jgi:hypothetical protein
MRKNVLYHKQPSTIKAVLEHYELYRNKPMRPTPSEMTMSRSVYAMSYTNNPFFELDFSGAISGAISRPHTRRSGPQQLGDTESLGKVRFAHTNIGMPLGLKPDPFLGLMKDGTGGYWIRVCAMRREWKAIEEQSILA